MGAYTVACLQTEDVMKSALKGIVKKSVKQYAMSPRSEWLLQWPGQVVIAVSQVYWTRYASRHAAFAYIVVAKCFHRRGRVRERIQLHQQVSYFPFTNRLYECAGRWSVRCSPAAQLAWLTF
jgi:hypothetical protein